MLECSYIPPKAPKSHQQGQGGYNILYLGFPRDVPEASPGDSGQRDLVISGILWGGGS